MLQIHIQSARLNPVGISFAVIPVMLAVVAKQLTREQAERKKAQAADFMDRIGEPERAEEFDDMSVEEYAEHKGLQLTNPRKRRTNRKGFMANGTSKADLQDQIDRAIDLLDDAYAPESSREDLAEAVGSALDILRGDDDSDDEDDDSDDDQD